MMPRRLLILVPFLAAACLHGGGDAPTGPSSLMTVDEWEEQDAPKDAAEADESPLPLDPPTPIVETLPLPLDTIGALQTFRAPRGVRRRITLEEDEPDDVVSVNFLDTPIEDVIAVFSETGERTILLGTGVAGATITADIRRQPWNIALETLLLANGFEIDQDEQTRMITVRSAEAAREREAQMRSAPEVFRINYGEANEIAGVIREVMGDRVQVSLSSATNSILVSAADDTLTEVADMIEDLDVLPTTLAIEVQILTIATQELRSLGLSFTIEDPDRPFGGQTGSGAGTAGQIPGSFGGGSQVMVEPSGIHTNHPAMLINRKSNASFSTFVERAITGTPYSFTSFVDALHGVSLAEVHARPTATTLSEKPVRIEAGDAWNVPTQGLVGSGQQGGGGGGGMGGQQGGGMAGGVAGGRERIQVGVTLDVTPSVLPNGKVRLKVNAERSGGELGPDGTVSESFQRGEWEVIVDNGETHVLGGLMMTETSKGTTGVPFLSQLPFIGRAFTKENEVSSKRELVFMITPRILQPELRTNHP